MGDVGGVEHAGPLVSYQRRGAEVDRGGGVVADPRVAVMVVVEGEEVVGRYNRKLWMSTAGMEVAYPPE